MGKKRSIILVVAIICIGILVTGGTYAWMTFGGTIINGADNGTTTCFILNYDYVDDDGNATLGGTLFQSSKPRAGLSGSVTMSIDSNCNVNGTGTIYLTVNGSTSATLYKKVKAHCEDSVTLQTLTNYTSSSACTSAGGKWVSANSKSALKYAVYENVTATPVAVGHINGTGNITLYSGFPLRHTSSKYYIYIWLDGELADNTYLGVSFDGDIHLGATQTE